MPNDNDLVIRTLWLRGGVGRLSTSSFWSSLFSFHFG